MPFICIWCRWRTCCCGGAEEDDRRETGAGKRKTEALRFLSVLLPCRMRFHPLQGSLSRQYLQAKKPRLSRTCGSSGLLGQRYLKGCLDRPAGRLRPRFLSGAVRPWMRCAVEDLGEACSLAHSASKDAAPEHSRQAANRAGNGVRGAGPFVPGGSGWG